MVIIVPCCASYTWEKNSKTAKILWNIGHLKEQAKWARAEGTLNTKWVWVLWKGTWSEIAEGREQKPHLGWRWSNIWWWEKTRLCVVSTQCNIQMINYRIVHQKLYNVINFAFYISVYNPFRVNFCKGYKVCASFFGHQVVLASFVEETISSIVFSCFFAKISWLPL